MPYSTLTSAIAAWRRRACAIALGNCGTSAFICELSSHAATHRTRGLASYADYLELQSLRSATQLAETRLADAGAAERAHPTRLWPFNYPVIEPVVDHSDDAEGARQKQVGGYIDVIL